MILDAKRNDIGSTAEAYARGMLGRHDSAWGADALTVSPYLGEDSLTPFVEVARERGAGLFVLVKTSNPGGGLLQDRVGRRARTASIAMSPSSSNDSPPKPPANHGYGLVGAVCRRHLPRSSSPSSAPRCRTRGSWSPATAAKAAPRADVAPAFDATGLGAVINNSRGIIFAHAPQGIRRNVRRQTNWQAAVAAATARDDRANLRQEETIERE